MDQNYNSTYKFQHLVVMFHFDERTRMISILYLVQNFLTKLGYVYSIWFILEKIND